MARFQIEDEVRLADKRPTFAHKLRIIKWPTDAGRSYVIVSVVTSSGSESSQVLLDVGYLRAVLETFE